MRRAPRTPLLLALLALTTLAHATHVGAGPAPVFASPAWFQLMREQPENQGLVRHLAQQPGGFDPHHGRDVVEIAGHIDFPIDLRPDPAGPGPELKVVPLDRRADAIDRSTRVHASGAFYTVLRPRVTYDLRWTDDAGRDETWARVRVSRPEHGQRKLLLRYVPGTTADYVLFPTPAVERGVRRRPRRAEDSGVQPALPLDGLPSAFMGMLGPSGSATSRIAGARDSMTRHTYAIDLPKTTACVWVYVDSHGSDLDLATRFGAATSRFEDDGDWACRDFGTNLDPNCTIHDPPKETLYIDVVNRQPGRASYTVTVLTGARWQKPPAPPSVVITSSGTLAWAPAPAAH